MRTWFALALVACGSPQFPLPPAVGQTHNPWPPAEPASPAIQASDERREAECVLPANVPGGVAPTPPDVRGDEEVLGIAFAAHRRAIAEAEIARDKAVHADVRAFADTVVADHVTALNGGITVARGLDLVSWSTSTSKRMESDAKQKARRLSALHGRSLDEQWVENLVNENVQVLVVFDAILARATTRDVKDQLLSDKAMATRQLSEARELQRKLDQAIASR